MPPGSHNDREILGRRAQRVGARRATAGGRGKHLFFFGVEIGLSRPASRKKKGLARGWMRGGLFPPKEEGWGGGKRKEWVALYEGLPFIRGSAGVSLNG